MEVSGNIIDLHTYIFESLAFYPKSWVQEPFTVMRYNLHRRLRSGVVTEVMPCKI